MDDSGGDRGRRALYSFLAEGKDLPTHSDQAFWGNPEKPTEAVDNLVDNLRKKAHRPLATGALVKLEIFSPPSNYPYISCS